ncbi:hypothetical protein B0H67DRAFT_558012 [Lasiosphaeris hirsuta]|uniref:Uncharacterized protein n=1 Tax=Lasiosphaeris hirsuta TaxID=260670 RepID=A0AA40DJ03_9PEZI|nr:hypothetical protein B0H67DRAFT_558012 [Lasiosphaeris hirsuta]
MDSLAEELSRAGGQMVLEVLFNYGISVDQGRNGHALRTMLRHGPADLLPAQWAPYYCAGSRSAFDLDVQFSTKTLLQLATHHNRTTHTHIFPVLPSELQPGDDEDVTHADNITAPVRTKRYLFDINPFHAAPDRGRGLNVIDAHWIDVSNGMNEKKRGADFAFSSSTSPRPTERDATRLPGVWSCKNFHRYRTRELWPMRETEFEGVRATVPYNSGRVLTGEYGAKTLMIEEWKG